MLNPKNINDIIQSILEKLPVGFKNMPAEIQRNFVSALRGVFERLDLVTRKEFEVQQKVLLRTREKLEALEKKLIELERQ